MNSMLARTYSYKGSIDKLITSAFQNTIFISEVPQQSLSAAVPQKSANFIYSEGLRHVLYKLIFIFIYWGKNRVIVPTRPETILSSGFLIIFTLLWRLLFGWIEKNRVKKLWFQLVFYPWHTRVIWSSSWCTSRPAPLRSKAGIYVKSSWFVQTEIF